MKLDSRDIYFALGTGLMTGLIAWEISTHLTLYSDQYIGAIIIVPFLWLMILITSQAVSSKIKLSSQFGKFIVIGFTNAILDYGVLNLFIAQTAIENGKMFSVFKGIAFVVANISSYLLNKYWTFDKSVFVNWKKQYPSFLTISVLSLAINVTTASLVVAYGPLWNISPAIWANVGAIVGSACALIPNFLGYKHFVFKDHKFVQ